MKFGTDQIVRVVPAADPSIWALVVGPVAVARSGMKSEMDQLAETIQPWLERKFMGAYCRYSVELRERLRWRGGVGADETMTQVMRLAVDLDEVRADNLELQQKVEGLESELMSLRGLFNAREHDLSGTTKELVMIRDKIHNYRRVLRTIADSSSDTASRLAAEGVLYLEEL